MPNVIVNRAEFLRHRQGRTFADVANDAELPFDAVLEFFSDEGRQRRMDEAELHHDRPPLAGVVREFESLPGVSGFLASAQPSRAKRLRQAVGVVVRIIMDRRGWRKTGRKGSLGVRVAAGMQPTTPGTQHNTGGLALWFLRAERYELAGGMPYPSVRERCRELESSRQLTGAT